MAITVLTSNETGADSLTDINANFADLDTTKADLASPTFTGTPVLPTGTTGVTQSASDNSTKLATTAYVDTGLSTISTTFSTTQVFSGTAPTSYTDLDLSSVIGVNQKVVMLRVIYTQATTGGVFFRRNGEASNGDHTEGGVHNAFITQNKFGYVIVPTDTSGVIEWKGGSAYTGCTINLEAYW